MGFQDTVVANMEKSLKDLESRFQSLAEKGKKGFVDNSQLNQYRKDVERLFEDYKKAGDRMKDLGAAVEQSMLKIKQASGSMKDLFVEKKFTDVENLLKQIAQSSSQVQETEKIINQELDKRVQKYKQLSDAATQLSAQKKQAQNAALLSITGMGVNAKGKPQQLLSNRSDEQKSAIINTAQSLFRKEDIQSAEALWNQLVLTVQRNPLKFGAAFNEAVPAIKKFKEQIQEAWEAYKQAETFLQPDIDKAVAAANKAKESVEAIGKINGDGSHSVNKGFMAEASRNAKAMSIEFNNLSHSVKEPKGDLEELNTVAAETRDIQESTKNATESASRAFGDNADRLEQQIKMSTRASNTLMTLRSRLLMLVSATTMLARARQLINKTFQDIQALDKSFASIAMVTSKSLDQMWASYDEYSKLAIQLGQSTNDVIQSSALFYQQGLETNEALALTTDTMKLATLAGSDFSTATKEMTAVLHAFNMEMTEGSRITDVYSELAAHAAASVDEIARAMERTAAIANSAGMSFENTSAFLTHMLETTQEGAENIGTSLKTIIARFGELKNNVSAADSEFEDLDLNKVDKALKSIGVQLKDENLQFRDLDEVLLEVSAKWSTLDRNTQRYVATIAAGSRLIVSPLHLAA